MADKVQENQGRLLPMDIEDELKKSFISYAMAVIVSRALPDVRDGLKPVHRRILYSMAELGVTPDKPTRKCARIVGDVLGKYHPHGDSSVYDALVRLAQPFNIRYPLVFGQGNFGSVDGDGAAAMRYTEARMSKLALEMMRDIDKETVDFYPNFDETLMQPEVMPSRFPNLLVNGSSGIAVGMATNIPPHNLGETIDAAVYMIDHPDCTVDDLMQFVKGPDFPTGGVILGKRGIYDAYHEGRGRIIVRAKSNIEEMSQSRQRIVVTEIPYMVNKARLIEKIAELVRDKTVEGISDIRDESDRNGMRIVIELKRDVNASVVLSTLYKHTQLQDTFGAIMLALVNGVPKILSLRQMLLHYIEHQEDVVRRRTIYDLNKAEARCHILEGLLRALDMIDEIVALIRASKNAQEARDGLITNFGFSEKQAQAILDMRLQRLTGLEREKLQEEYDSLLKDIEYYKKILADHGMLMSVIRQELVEVRDKYADERRTEISAMEGEIDMLDLVQEEDMVLTMTHFGYVKRLPKATYRQQRRGGKGVIGAATREEDFVEHISIVNTHADMLFFTSRGRVQHLMCYEIPEASRTSRGTALVNLLRLDPGEKVTAMLALPDEDPEGHFLIMVTKLGTIKRTSATAFANLRKAGLIAMELRDDDELVGVVGSDGKGDILVGTRAGMAIRFSETDIREMGRAAIGVRAIELEAGDEVISLARVDDECSVLSITRGGYGKRTRLDEYRCQNRAGKGIKAMNLTERTGLLAGQIMVRDEDDILIMTNDGTVIRMPVSDVVLQGRNTMGVRMMRVGESSVASVTVVEPEPDEEEGAGETAATESDMPEMPEGVADGEEEQAPDDTDGV